MLLYVDRRNDVEKRYCYYQHNHTVHSEIELRIYGVKRETEHSSERASGHTHRFIMCTSTHLNKPIEPTNQPTLSIHIASNPYTHTSIQIDRWMYEHVCYGIWSSARFFLFSVRCEILSLHTAQKYGTHFAPEKEKGKRHRIVERKRERERERKKESL